VVKKGRVAPGSIVGKNGTRSGKFPKEIYWEKRFDKGRNPKKKGTQKLGEQKRKTTNEMEVRERRTGPHRKRDLGESSKLFQRVRKRGRLRVIEIKRSNQGGGLMNPGVKKNGSKKQGARSTPA